MSPLQLAFVVVAALLGGAAQSVLGFGAAFTTVPAIALVAPELIPGAALVAFLPLTGLMAFRERGTIDVRAVARISTARVPGILLGAWAVRLLDPRGLTLGVAVVLLAAVASAAMGWTASATPTAERLAGAVSGFSGTAVGLGGPPLAVLYQDRTSAERRPTLALVFGIGIVLSLTALAVSGSFTAAQARLGAGLAGAVVVGLVLAAPLRRLPDHALRTGLLVWAATGSVVALAQALFG